MLDIEEVRQRHADATCRDPAYEDTLICMADVPLLIAEIEQLRREVDDLQDDVLYTANIDYREKFERLAQAGEVYMQELRDAVRAAQALLDELLKWEDEGYLVNDEDSACLFCYGYGAHTADCLITRAKQAVSNDVL